MKICDMTQSYTPSSGGIRTYVDAKRDWLLRETDAEHLLIVPGERDRVFRDGRSTIHEVAAPGIPGYPPYRMILRAHRVEEILASVRPDLIELGSAYFLSGAAFRHRRRHPCAVVGFYHTDFPTAYAYTYASRIGGRAAGRAARNLARSYARSVYSKCDHTITASPALATALRRLGIDPVSVVHLGVDDRLFHPGRRDPVLRASLGLEDREVLIIYAGRFDSEKRVDLLLQAFRRLQPWMKASMLLIGDGPLRPALEEAALQMPRLRLRPYEKDKENLARLLASADIYITAGPHETFALSVLEAQACGLPVVGVRAGALIERVGEETGILGTPGSAEELARNVVRLCAGEPVAKGRAARRMVENSYSWDRTLPRLIEIYEQTVRRSRTLAPETPQGKEVRPIAKRSARSAPWESTATARGAD